MQRALVVMTCLACVGHGRRVQSSAEGEAADSAPGVTQSTVQLKQPGVFPSLKALSTSLLALNPAVAFNMASGSHISAMKGPISGSPAMIVSNEKQHESPAADDASSMYSSMGLSKAAMTAAMVAALGFAQSASAGRSGGRVGGRIGGGGGMRAPPMRGGGGGYAGGGGVMMSPGMSYGFSPFGFSPFGFSPFGYGFSPFGFGFGLPPQLLVIALLALAATSFRESRLSEEEDLPGAVLCLQVAAYCATRTGDSLYSRLAKIARSADTTSYEGLQALVSDSSLAMLRSSNDWLAARSVSETKGLFGNNEIDASYNRLLVKERAKWESEQRVLKRVSGGQPTYMVATLVVLLRNGQALPEITSVSTLREAIQNLAAEVSVPDNLMGAELLWTPEDTSDVMDKDDMFLNFPELVTV